MWSLGLELWTRSLSSSCTCTRLPLGALVLGRGISAVAGAVLGQCCIFSFMGLLPMEPGELGVHGAIAWCYGWVCCCPWCGPCCRFLALVLPIFLAIFWLCSRRSYRDFFRTVFGLESALISAHVCSSDKGELSRIFSHDFWPGECHCLDPDVLI